MIQTWAAGITPLLEKECYQNYYTKAPLFRRKGRPASKAAGKGAEHRGMGAIRRDESILRIDRRGSV